MITRAATRADMEPIYLMGADAWGSELSQQQYVQACRSSKKYQLGSWYCLEHSKTLVSSLVVYTNCFSLERSFAGFGSVATLPGERNKGYASRLISACINNLRNEHYGGVYLFNDADSSVYQRCGFKLISSTNGLMFQSFDGSAQQSHPTYF